MSEAPITGSVDASVNAIRARLAGLLHAVPDAERADAQRVISLATISQADARAKRVDAALEPAADNTRAARRELQGLIERLGRRSGAAVPFASLARALNARLAQHDAVALEALALADEALSFRGY